MTTEVLNVDYTESDAGGYLSETATHVTATSLPYNISSYLYKSFGAGYFTGSAYIEGEFNITSSTGTTAQSLIFGFSDTLGPQVGTVNASFFRALRASGSFQIAVVRYESSSATVGSGSVNLSTGTTYYYRAGFLSALGQYGALTFQIYSDSARTIKVDSVILTRTVSGTYEYLYPQLSVNSGSSTDLITDTNGNITRFAPAAGADLTAFTEVDSAADIVVHANCLVVTTMATNVTSYVHKDKGVDYYSGNYTLGGLFNLTAFAGAWGASNAVNLLALTNALGKADETNDSHSVEVFWVSSTTCKFRIREISNGSRVSSGTWTDTISTNFPCLVELSRDTGVGTYGTLYLKLFTDIGKSSQLGSTVSLACRDNGTPDIVAFRYFNAIQSSDTGATPTISFTFGGISTGEANSASYTSSGGFVVGGSATNSRSAYATGSGGILLGGSATHSRSTAYIATGGFIIGGAADFSANGAQSVSYTSSGGFIIGGTAANSRSSSHTGSGGFRLGGSAAYSFTLQTNVQEIVFELYDSTGAPITGATTLTCKLRTTPGAQIYDWSDETFKSSGWTTISADLNEIDATNLPGIYKKEIDVSNFADGRYQVFISYSATQSQHGSIEFLVDDGQMVDEYTATNTHTALIDIAATPAAVLAAATTTPIAAEIVNPGNTLTVLKFLALK